MTLKLGEILVKSGDVTMEELNEALKSQVIFGGRLGTNMIEMGYINEEKLAIALGKLFSIRYIQGDDVMNIPECALHLLPKQLVEKHKVLPLVLDKRRLSLAMVDPGNFVTLEELSFVTGFVIEPVVCPEIRMIAALEKHYSIPRNRRYIKIQGLSRATPRKQSQSLPPDISSHEDQGGRQIAKEECPFANIDISSEVNLVPADSALTVELTHEVEVGDVTIETDRPPALKPLSVDSKQPANGESSNPESLDTLSSTLAEAGNRDDIAEAIIRYTGKRFDHVALFIIKGGMASGWVGQSGGKNIENFQMLTIPLDSPSVIQLVNEGRSIYIGPISDTPCNSIMLKGLGVGTPSTSVLIPLLMMGRVVTVFYADGSGDKISDQVQELKTIVAKAAIAFEILILKNKLLSL